MRNRYLEKFDSMVKISVKGNNVYNYLKRVMNDKIKIIRIIPISKKEIHLILKIDEYQKLIEYRSVYKVDVLKYYGKCCYVNSFKKYSILFLFLIMGILVIFFLSRIIFSVEVIHSDKEIREFLMDELREYGISKYYLKKSYFELEDIEDKILEKNKDRLEWLEIVSYGTKYTVRVEERKLNDRKNEFQYQNIVSRKNAVLVEIDAISGEKVKDVNEFVSKGDTVISGSITLPNNSVVLTKADGVVLGEVWYTVNMEYPFVYQESNFTGNSKTVYSIYFYNKKFSFFDFSKYRSFKSKEKVLISSNFLDIHFAMEKHYEVIVKDEVYTEDMVYARAIMYLKEKIMKDNLDIREVKDVQIMSSLINDKGIRFKMFVKTLENIGEVLKIDNELKNTEE